MSLDFGHAQHLVQCVHSTRSASTKNHHDLNPETKPASGLILPPANYFGQLKVFLPQLSNRVVGLLEHRNLEDSCCRAAAVSLRLTYSFAKRCRQNA